MRILFLAIAALALGGCPSDYSEPKMTCVEKVNVRIAQSRGGEYEMFDCQRYALRCVEPLVLVQSPGDPNKIFCRLPSKPSE